MMTSRRLARTAAQLARSQHDAGRWVMTPLPSHLAGG